LAEAVYAPLKAWAAQAQVEPLPEALANEEGQAA
jgi:exodeoxyribonuclease V gamma subunit